MRELKGKTVEMKINSQSSHYKRVIGEVVEMQGKMIVKATKVIDRWSDKWENHPTSCLISTFNNTIVRVL